MDLPRNRLKLALAERRPQIGLWSSLASHVSVEVLAGSGFDFLLLDTEHSPNDPPMVHTQLQAMMEHAATEPVVRPAWNDMVLIKRYLDIGVRSFLVPYVQTVEEARAAVAHTRYPPQGVRGFAGTARSSRFGRINDYHARAHEEILVIVQAETPEALSRIESIAAVDGVDGIFIGPADLAASMGHLGQLAHPEVQKAIDDAIRRIAKAGKAPGILFSDETLVRHYLEIGATFVAVGADVGILARESEKLAQKYRR